MDVIENKNDYETLVLVSGDSDFAPLLQLMKMKYGKICVVMATKIQHINRTYKMRQICKFCQTEKIY